MIDFKVEIEFLYIIVMKYTLQGLKKLNSLDTYQHLEPAFWT
jgi:hypothetical protein